MYILSQRFLDWIMVLLWVLYNVVANCSYASEEWIAFLFRVTEFHWMGLEGKTSP